MPSLNKEYLESIIDLSNFRVFIETGTFEGDTILNIEQCFDKLYTIEISEYYYNKTKQKYNGNKINFILGDSSIELSNILEKLNENVVIFLDGHWSSGLTGKGSKDVPLYEEIDNIIKYRQSMIIIIDDVRLFGRGPHNKTCNEDWSEISIENILQKVKFRLIDYKILGSELSEKDRLILYLNNI